MKARPDDAAPCPCGSGASHAACCADFIAGRRPAPTAEALMRSRYAAFALGAVDYLMTTHHGAALDPRIRDGLARTVAGTEWLALTILATTGGGPDDATGTVDFVAAHRARGPLAVAGTAPIEQMHELSHFAREGGRWVYTEGESRPPYRPGRNETCWCGSGRKAKRCHP